MNAATPRYHSASIALHWLMFAVLVGVYACIELRELYPKGSDPREALKQWHFMLGLTVFLLVWVRLGFILAFPGPALSRAHGLWFYRLGRGAHILLYGLMIAMPIGGWLVLSGEGKEIPFWGLRLPSLMAENEALAETIAEVHETVGVAGYFLIGLHAAAALFHHYFLRDDTLKRMLPF